MKIRIRFSKMGVMKFIGHLDIMRYFQMAIRRSGIDIVYTTGYSPHQVMSFALPLGVGLTSEGEYLDIEINASCSSTQAVRLLNEQMAEGMKVLSFLKLPDDSKNAMSIVAAADYNVSFREGKEPCPDWENKFAAFLGKTSIVILKKTKKSEKEMDIKPFIYQYETTKGCAFLRLAAGSVTNIKPELVFEAFYEELGVLFDKTALLITRKELYSKEEGESFRLVSLEEPGEEIE